MRNEPYVKKYNKDGECINPIGAGYFHHFSNRKERRKPLGSHKFMGNHKGIPLTVVGTQKYLRVVQRITNKNLEDQIIYHYLPYK